VNEHLESLFPGLRGVLYEITSPAEPDYNCIAWAAGDNSRWWEPDGFGLYFWPESAPRAYTLEAYVRAFTVLGFERCEDPAVEEWWEKVAIFATEQALPTHAARQLPDGTWTSKLGKLEDINHQDVDHVSGTNYGRPVVFVRRRIPPNPQRRQEANP